MPRKKKTLSYVEQLADPNSPRPDLFLNPADYIGQSKKPDDKPKPRYAAIDHTKPMRFIGDFKDGMKI